MNEHDIINAIGTIDEELIINAEKIRKKKKIPIFKLTAVAASLFLCIGCVYLAVRFADVNDVTDSNGMNEAEDLQTDDRDEMSPTLNEGVGGAETQSAADIIPDEGEAPENTEDGQELPEIKVEVTGVFESGVFATVKDGMASYLKADEEVIIKFEPVIWFSVPVEEGRWINETKPFDESLFNIGDTFIVQFSSFEDNKGKDTLYSDAVILLKGENNEK